jgi:hypothetical protein
MIIFVHLVRYAVSEIYRFSIHWWGTSFIDIIRDHDAFMNGYSFITLAANAIGNCQ